jgi:stage II sporulation protein D
LFVAVDKLGKLALIEALPLEELLRGLVPSEMFASAPAEALKAQAITARGEVLAKIGARHLTDPYLLCSEQHCQVYGGLGSERASTDAAVRATRGEALFSRGGRLVDSVYSAVCGGHTEDNDVVWGGPPDPSLRGVSDLVDDLGSGDLRDEAQLRGWIDRVPRSYCRLSGAAPSTKIRWSRRFSAAELAELLEPLGVGRVLRLEPRERGASGRASVLHVVGDRGEAEVRGELRIRKLLKNLNSAAFYVEAIAGTTAYPTSFVFHGAGWGHGVGMCQTGAIGRASQGSGYREILSHYFNGAELTRIY